MFFVANSQKKTIGKIHTSLVKTNENISIITKLQIPNQANNQWVDSIVVNSANFEPLYHSSINPQREMVMKYGKKINGYFKNLKTNSTTEILETTNKPYFDSNSYPHIIRLLPLKDNYTAIINIFDYNPKSKVGVMNVNIKNTESSILDFNGEQRKVWKVDTTTDISDNKILTTFFIDKLTKKVLKQITNNMMGQLIMERQEL
ncbi:hypothetical protein ACOSQB_01885 [Tenacibaculum sp. MEBiC07804]